MLDIFGEIIYNEILRREWKIRKDIKRFGKYNIYLFRLLERESRGNREEVLFKVILVINFFNL